MKLLTFKKFHRIDENGLAKTITLLEGKKKSMSIAQVKECLKFTLAILHAELEDNPKGLLELLKRKR